MLRAILLLLGLAMAGAPALAQADLAALRQAAEAGDPDAAFEYGYELTFPESGDPDPVTGRYWLSRAAEAGNPSASYVMGLIHLDGIGTEPDPQAARPFFRQAWEAGDAPAGLMLAEILLYDIDDGEAQARTVLNALLADADVGALARLTLADSLFFPGPDLPADRPRAAELAGEALAMDPDLAEAHYILGIAAMEGIGRPAEPAAALTHWRNGARAGDTYSMLALADALADGAAGDPDPVEAQALYASAAALGDAEADTLARELAAGLSAEEQTEARRRRDAWLAEIGE